VANRLLLGLKSVPVVKLRRNKVVVHGAHTCKLHAGFPGSPAGSPVDMKQMLQLHNADCCSQRCK